MKVTSSTEPLENVNLSFMVDVVVMPTDFIHFKNVLQNVLAIYLPTPDHVKPIFHGGIITPQEDAVKNSNMAVAKATVTISRQWRFVKRGVPDLVLVPNYHWGPIGEVLTH